MQIKLATQMMFQKTFVLLSREKMILFSNSYKQKCLGYLTLKQFYYDVEVLSHLPIKADKIGFKLIFKDLGRIVEFKAMNEKELEIWLRGLLAVTERFAKFPKVKLLLGEI
jgi:hypothetical protein